MKNKELWRTVKFALFSASAGIIETLAMILCEEVIQIPGHYICYTIALVLSVLWNFTLNRKFTFKSAENVPKAMFLVFLFYLPFAPFTIWTEHYLADRCGWNEYLVLAINMALNLVLEYLWDAKVVYRNSTDTNDLAKKQAETEAAEAAKACRKRALYFRAAWSRAALRVLGKHLRIYFFFTRSMVRIFLMLYCEY